MVGRSSGFFIPFAPVLSFLGLSQKPTRKAFPAWLFVAYPAELRNEKNSLAASKEETYVQDCVENQVGVAAQNLSLVLAGLGGIQLGDF